MVISQRASAENWRAQAACNDSPDLFFPIGTTGPAVQQVQAAKSVCQHCPVRDDCLEWALTHDVDHGVWGGLEAAELRERRAERRNAGRQSRTERARSGRPWDVQSGTGQPAPGRREPGGRTADGQ